MSATEVRSLTGVLDTESGGAIAVIKELLQQPIARNAQSLYGHWIVIVSRCKNCDQF